MPFLGGRGQASRGYFGGGTTPDAPTSLVSTKGNGQISVAFSAPSFSGGLDITTYQYALSTDSYATWTTRATGTTDSPLVITGLSNGTSYGVKLRAVNALGSGTASDAATAVTPSTVPNAPTSLSSTAGNTQLVISFTPPSDNGGLAITNYEYALSTNSGSSYGAFTALSPADGLTPVTITGLTNGTAYYVKLRAVNGNGSGTESTAVTTNTTPSTVPNAPTNVQGTANGETSSTVSWTAPANTGNPRPDGGSAINGYKVEYALSPYSSYTVFNADTGNANTSIPVTGLTNGGSYKFRVTAKNVNGFGDASTPSGVVVTNIVPAAPTIGTMTRSGTTSTVDSLAWTAPAANGGSAITGYVYQTTTNDGSTFTTAVATGSTSTTKTFDPGYTNVTTKVRVAAVNSLGTPGPYSAVSTVGYGGWTSTGVAIPKTDCPLPTCSTCPEPSCAACNNAPDCSGGCPCDCGTASRTASSGTRGASTLGTRGASTRGTASKTCYKWTRGDQETSASYNQDSTVACDAAFSECTAGTCGSCSAGTCGTCSDGSCSACSACSGTRTTVSTDGTYNGQAYYVFYNAYGTQYMILSGGNGNCGYCTQQAWTITLCLGTYTITDAGCQPVGPPKC